MGGGETSKSTFHLRGFSLFKVVIVVSAIWAEVPRKTATLRDTQVQLVRSRMIFASIWR